MSGGGVKYDPTVMDPARPVQQPLQPSPTRTGQFSPEMLPYFQNMINGVTQPQQIYSGLGSPIPTYGQPPGPGFAQLQNIQQPTLPGAMTLQQAYNEQYGNQPPQGPRPGANIGRPAPGYGKKPQRGPVPRNMTPTTTNMSPGMTGLTQGLGGLTRYME